MLKSWSSTQIRPVKRAVRILFSGLPDFGMTSNTSVRISPRNSVRRKSKS